MAEPLMHDAEALHRALDSSGEEVEISLSRETAEWVARVIDARVHGQEIVLTHGHTEVTPAEAAVLLGMSRPQVRKLMDEGKLAFRKVGTHYRIRMSSVRVFLRAEQEQMEARMESLSRLQNELGLLE